MNIKRVIAPFLGDDLFAYKINEVVYYVWYPDSDILEEIDNQKINIRHVKYINPITLELLSERPNKDVRYDLAISFEGLMRRLCSEEEQGI